MIKQAWCKGSQVVPNTGVNNSVSNVVAIDVTPIVLEEIEHLPISMDVYQKMIAPDAIIKLYSTATGHMAINYANWVPSVIDTEERGVYGSMVDYRFYNSDWKGRGIMCYDASFVDEDNASNYPLYLKWEDMPQ